MPRQRLAWFKVWVGATRHEKVVTLDNLAFRVWVELLDAASEQPMRGRFTSCAAAAAIVRRPVGVVRKLAQARLLDEREDGVWLHDWADWQRWRPADEAEDTSHDSPPDGGGITQESHRNNSAKTTEKRRKTGSLVRVREDGEGDVDKELDEEVDTLPAANAAGPSHPPPGFSEDERSEIDEIETTLEPFGLHQRPEFWRKVLDTYGELPLGMEALKQADWLRRNGKRITNVSRYTNWLDKAMVDYREHAPPALVEMPRRAPHVCTIECEHECFDLECAVHGAATRDAIQRRIASHAKGALSA